MRTAPQWPHLEEAAALAARVGTATLGSTVVHADALSDSFRITRDGRAVLGEWNAPVVGAAWIDTVCLLMTVSGDGLDADALLAERPLTAPVDPDDVDTVLALFCGYFLERRDQPRQHSSPYLRRAPGLVRRGELGLAGPPARLDLTSPYRAGFGRRTGPLVT